MKVYYPSPNTHHPHTFTDKHFFPLIGLFSHTDNVSFLHEKRTFISLRRFMATVIWLEKITCEFLTLCVCTSMQPCTVRVSLHVRAYGIQLLASFHRLPLWLPSCPSMPEVQHQSLVTLVPDTHVYSKHRRAQPPPEMFVLSKKKIKELQVSATLFEWIHTSLKTQGCPQQMFVLCWLWSVLRRLEYNNSFLVEIFMSRWWILQPVRNNPIQFELYKWQWLKINNKSWHLAIFTSVKNI